MWFSSIKTETREKNQRTAIYTAMAAAIALFCNLIINQVYWHPRPFVDHQVHQLIPHLATESSFASDHTILAFSVAFMMLMRTTRWRGIVLFFAVLTAVSRVFVGVHYPADVIGGAVIAYIASMLVIRLAKFKWMELLVQFVFWVYAKLASRLPFFSKYIHKRI
jgi:undecaprenyl-diphosphatase